MNWYGPPTWRTWLLAPFSFIYGLVIRVWHALYDLGLRRATKLEGGTIISVGNLVVGGAGKTPIVIHLANEGLANGRKVAVLTRGYGRASSAQLRFTAQQLPSVADAGDEPRLIARKCPGATLFVGADRVASAREAIAAGFDLLILDDGFQHRRLARDVDLLLDVGLGNGFMLPAGPLREPASHASRATHVWQRDVDVKTAVTQLRGPDGVVRPLNAQKVVLLLGVARPDRVWASVEAAGATIHGIHAYGDHHVFTADELELARRDAVAHDALLVTTEKDAERLPEASAHVLELTVSAPSLASLLSPRR